MKRPEVTWDGVFWRVEIPDGEVVESYDKSYLEGILDSLERADDIVRERSVADRKGSGGK